MSRWTGDPDKCPDPDEYMDPLEGLAHGEPYYLEWLKAVDIIVDQRSNGSTLLDLTGLDDWVRQMYDSAYKPFEAADDILLQLVGTWDQ